MFFDVYVLELLRFETITSSDATLSDINVVLCYVLSQYLCHAYSMHRYYTLYIFETLPFSVFHMIFQIHAVLYSIHLYVFLGTDIQ
jgi:hypothetical protein